MIKEGKLAAEEQSEIDRNTMMAEQNDQHCQLDCMGLNIA